jgi:hypothetical protein
MKLEYLDDIRDGGRFTNVVSDKLIRLYDFDYIQAMQLRDAIQYYIIKEGKSLYLNELDFIIPMNCNLSLQLSNMDLGITTMDRINFYCDLTIFSYQEMIQLIEPFCHNDLDGYQWLYDVDTEIDFLFSPGGSW